MTVQGRSSSSLVSSAAAGGGDEGDDGYGWGEEEGGESEPEEQDPVIAPEETKNITNVCAYLFAYRLFSFQPSSLVDPGA